MAEPTISITWTQLKAAVGDFLGYTNTPANWTSAQADDIDDIVQRGMNQFYFPPQLRNDIAIGIQTVHTWSFLEPTAAITTASADYDYDLADDFGGLKSNFTFGVDQGYMSIPTVGEARIRVLRQLQGTATGKPAFAGIKPKTVTGATSIRWQVLFWPIPDGVYTLTYSYSILMDRLKASYEHPLGGAPHRETVLESCLAIAELSKNDEIGVHHQKFIERLEASIRYDRQLFSRDYFGYNGDASSVPREEWSRYHHTITYNGVEYP